MCKVWMYEHACIFVNNFFNIWVLELLYNGLLRKIWWDKVYCIYVLKRNQTKFILYFIWIFMVFYMNIRILNELSGNLNREKWIRRKIKPWIGLGWNLAQGLALPVRSSSQNGLAGPCRRCATRPRSTITTPVTDAAAWPTSASWRPPVGEVAAHGSAVQGETPRKHDWVAELTRRLGDIEVAGGLSAATPLNDRWPAVVVGDRGTSLQLGGG
jgi:hypothetical protein